MELVIAPQLVGAALAAIVGGLFLLGRGFVGYRAAERIAGIGTSTISGLAVGEVRVSGVVEAAELTLVSPLQSEHCVYYRSTIHDSGRDDATTFEDERAIGFRVRDASGTVRVFPRGAAFDVPVRFSESTGLFGDQPAGLRLRAGAATAVGEPTREAQIAALLTVNAAVAGTDDGDAGRGWSLASSIGTPRPVGLKRYREARIEPGDEVTIVGQVLPFDQLDDPDGADDASSPNAAFGPHGDAEIAADVAAAAAAGLLAPDPETAWGNAAIPGFGIGKPVTAPHLDPEARRPELAAPDAAATARRTFDIGPLDLVLAASPGEPMTIALGRPGAAAARRDSEFLVGLLGGATAIGAAVVLAVMIQGGA
ncbi:MAG TPA: hypothetical protein VGC90_11220 [Candidatus Limnocylindrales bacterium]